MEPNLQPELVKVKMFFQLCTGGNILADNSASNPGLSWSVYPSSSPIAITESEKTLWVSSPKPASVWFYITNSRVLRFAPA